MDGVIAKMMDNLPVYEGKDPNTSNDWYCKTCYKHEKEDGVRLKTCSRCSVVRYCSVSCQKEDFQEHRSFCRKIKSLTAKLESQAAELRRSTYPFGGEPRNLFETDVGHFWGILDSRDYCRTRYELADELQHLAHWYEVRPLLEIVLGHQLELLRLMASDNLGIRDLVPFTLLSLNRDDDCYAFIKHWVPILQDGRDVSDLHKNTLPGQWIYPRGQDKRKDILEECNVDGEYFSLAFLAALCIIKLRMIAAHEAKKKQMDVFSKTADANRLGDALVHVEQAYTESGGEAQMISEQEKYVQRYFSIIQKNNPTLLPSIINPKPLKSQPAPNYIQHGSPSEAWGVLNSSNRHFARIPGVEDRLKRIYGENPSYDYVIDDLF